MMHVYTGKGISDGHEIIMITTEQRDAEIMAIKAMQKQKGETCKNQSFDYKVSKQFQDHMDRSYKFDIINDGCNNPRRNGSAWCQECSDKFKQANNK